MTIDERALDFAENVLHAKDVVDAGLSPVEIRKGLKAAIEAYENALWKPIEEMPIVCTNVMVWVPTPSDPWGDWIMLHGRDCAHPDKEALFRTVEPPNDTA